jgi:hypothetical protein
MYSKIEEKKSHDVHLYDFSNVSPAKRFLDDLQLIIVIVAAHRLQALEI